MRLSIRYAFDAHLHLRRGDMLRRVLPQTLPWCDRALVMPNTDPPILTAQDAEAYRQEILAAGRSNFEVLMTIKLVPSTTPKIIREARAANVLAGKYYPKNTTTNSADGVEDIHSLYPVFEAMEEIGMVLCLHGEMPNTCCLDSEVKFLGTLKALANDFPRLKIVMEHISTEAAVRTVKRLPDTVAATITPHHLFLTIDDVCGGKLHPHQFCKPVPKRRPDREALIDAAMSGNPKFFLGTDSAPHPQSMKECAEGAPGIFNAPVALPLLAQRFEEEDDRAFPQLLEDFTSRFGAQFYNLTLNQRFLVIERSPWKVPLEYDGIVPFKAGETIPWKLA